MKHLGEDLISHSPWRISERGPWQSKEDPTFWHVDVISGGLRVARVSGVGKDRALANAQLIATAPDLLAAIKKVLTTSQHGLKWSGDITANILKEAIAKAERAT